MGIDVQINEHENSKELIRIQLIPASRMVEKIIMLHSACSDKFQGTKLAKRSVLIDSRRYVLYGLKLRLYELLRLLMTELG